MVLETGRRKSPPFGKPCLSLRTYLEDEEVDFHGAAQVSLGLKTLALGLMSEAQFCTLRFKVWRGVIQL